MPACLILCVYACIPYCSIAPQYSAGSLRRPPCTCCGSRNSATMRALKAALVVVVVDVFKGLIVCLAISRPCLLSCLLLHHCCARQNTTTITSTSVVTTNTTTTATTTTTTKTTTTTATIQGYSSSAAHVVAMVLSLGINLRASKPLESFPGEQ